jgi:hypothetical protein
LTFYLAGALFMTYRVRVVPRSVRVTP